ncbi:transient receptor potential cation channel subfamily M member-like 2 isoform X2 [Homarus americanus]|nr:transient receptor potential cation channel subfamily M member-like 2 isoform X2 [Homarus americanus]
MNIQEKVDRKQQHKTSGLANNIFNTLSSLTRGNSVQLSSVAETSSRPPTATSKLSLQELETGVGQGEDNSVFSRENILLANGVTSRSRCNVIQPSSRPNTLPRIVMPAPDSPWRQDTHLYELPTNAYGSITFMNETAGSNKPSKYVRLSSTSNVKNVLTLLTDYWCLMDPNRPQLVISVTGGAKNFQLDGKKKEIFSSGLIKAVKSTNAWLLTGGMHVGIMKSVGEAVNRGQFIVKIKRKNFFSEERVHMIRGIRCLGVLPWGYIKNRESLMNSDVNQFTSVKYKVEENAAPLEPVSLDGDHTHFLFVDDGHRNVFRGVDDFRTRLEEGIRKPEPEGLGVPVVLLLLDGGVNSIIKCNLALKRDIPIVVVAGTGRAADLLAYAVSMTIHTPSGRFIMRKGHRAQLVNRISITMREIKSFPEKQKCADLLIECCTKVNMITIFDINSNEDMDKYILYALLTGEDVTSMQDQLSLALLWDRPDIAECEIFPAQKNWPSGALEDLMTTALLEEKVEFVKLFTMNGLVMADYLTVKKLRHLYNEACIPNSHLMRLLQRASQNNYHYLFHVHNVLQAMMRRHHDDIYTSDTPQAQSDNPSINYLTFEDPYMELLLWAIFSRRAWLANYLWQRCNSPLCAAIAASCLYQSLWRSLGAKNTDILEEYNKNKNTFELFAVNLLGVCYQQDVINALGLVERRNAKWGNSDCLELAVMANDLIFISTPAAQASVELNWRRGMSRAPFFAVMIANVFPLLIFWPRFFRFQKLGDNGGELTIPQKMVVFYKSPISKFCAHSTAFVIFLIVYAYVVLFDFKYEMSITEKFLFVWICIYVIDEISEIISEQSLTLRGKISDWAGSVWNRFDIVAFFLAFLALGLRLHRQTFKWGRIAYAVNTNVFYCRLFRMYHVNYHLGPKLVIFYRMISEVLVFLALLVIFILGYGIASQALLHPSRDAGSLNSTSVSSIMEDVLLTPYWQMYGELLLDEAEGDDQEVCHQKSCLINEFCTNATTTCKEKVSCVCESSKDYSWVVNLMLFFYLIIGNIMLLNLLIAIFTYVFDEVQENSMEIWKFEMLRLIREYDMKPSLIPPFVVLEYIWRVSKGTWKLFCRKHRENLEDYMKSTLDSLRIFEKEAISTYLVRITLDEECSVDNRVKRMSEKIDKITKYIEQKGEMEEIEEDLEWIIHETDGLKQNKGQSILLTNQSSEQQNTNIEKLISIQHQKHPTDGVQGRSRVEVMMDGDDESNQEDENELEDPPAQEVSNKDIEKEIKLLQAKVIGGRPYSSRSCAGTPSIAHRRNMDHLAGLTTRLDDLHEQLHLSQTTFNTMMKTIMARLDSIEGKI